MTKKREVLLRRSATRNRSGYSPIEAESDRVSLEGRDGIFIKSSLSDRGQSVVSLLAAIFREVITLPGSTSSIFNCIDCIAAFLSFLPFRASGMKFRRRSLEFAKTGTEHDQVPSAKRAPFNWRIKKKRDETGTDIYA